MAAVGLAMSVTWNRDALRMLHCHIWVYKCRQIQLQINSSRIAGVTVGSTMVDLDARFTTVRRPIHDCATTDSRLCDDRRATWAISLLMQCGKHTKLIEDGWIGDYIVVQLQVLTGVPVLGES